MPTPQIIDWEGVLQSPMTGWFNEGGLGSGWSVANVQATLAGGGVDASCTGPLQAGNDYAGPCQLKGAAISLSFALTVTEGTCKAPKPWQCASGNATANCTPGQ